ncbi:metal ABC transporter solute-binding protein, Zn/Mn family [Salsuginibacillus kocurii]|uniref:metal ABC transporter solute-binding protein, Zn/Mn family n=1 Tax=Salsuginibacillus kocurii TaxID=427078 RepID=UPI00037A8791|nr:zinc ABC transporter substrate-binding protein [Salsuginibacillus kocurii]
MKKHTVYLSILLTTSLLLSACADDEEVGEEETGEEEQDETEEQTAEEDPDEDPVELHTTLFALEDFANRIGGEEVQVENVVPVGADAHTFEPSPQDMIDIAESDIFLYNGASMEGFADAVKETVEGEDVHVIEAVEGIDLREDDHDHDHDHDHDEEGHEDDHDHDHDHDEEGHEDDHDHDEEGHEDDHDHGEEGHEDDHDHDEEGHEDDHDHGEEGHEDDHDHGEEGHEDDHDHDEEGHDHDHDHDHGDYDPHVWLDPVLALEMAENIKNGLVDVRPEQEELFEENFEELKSELEQLDEDFENMVTAADHDTFIVSHAGYGYWEDRYGLHQVGISGVSPTNEPSQQQLEGIIEDIEENDIEYIYFEQNIPNDIAEVVQDEAGVDGLDLHNLEVLVEEDVENDEDYISLMEQNIENLESGLND